MGSDSHSGRKSTENVRSFLTLAGFRYWFTTLLSALVGKTLPSWVCGFPGKTAHSSTSNSIISNGDISPNLLLGPLYASLSCDH